MYFDKTAIINQTSTEILSGADSAQFNYPLNQPLILDSIDIHITPSNVTVGSVQWQLTNGRIGAFETATDEKHTHIFAQVFQQMPAAAGAAGSVHHRFPIGIAFQKGDQVVAYMVSTGTSWWLTWTLKWVVITPERRLVPLAGGNHSAATSGRGSFVKL